ncbi:hypothetical protein, partial [Rhizobium johnstonii]|uniref:hypothetical protein n=1 Tax=Rhizobium johnstonii TaxID=3019933 RepID=UPI003F9CAA0D
GRMEAYDCGLRLSGVRGFAIWIDVGTGFKRYNYISADPVQATTDRIQTAIAKGWDAVRADHVADRKGSRPIDPGLTPVPKYVRHF